MVPRTTFGQATTIAQTFYNDPSDGIVGLAFASIAVDGVPPILINAYNQNLLDAPLFTVWLQLRDTSDAGVPAGLYTYGAVDTTHCGPVIAYHPLSSATVYQFEATKFALGNYSTSGSW